LSCRIDHTQLTVLRLVTAVDHPAAADVCDGVRDTARDRHHDDGGDCHSNATVTSVLHG
jgi:hypothetical protein